MMGKPQPLKNPQDEKPSFEQSTTSAISIQIEQLFCMQQFIKEPPVSFLRRYVSVGVFYSRSPLGDPAVLSF